MNYFVQRRQKAIDAYQARLEFKRRKTALGAAKAYRKCRTSGCTFDEMLELTNPLRRKDVIEQYAIEKNSPRLSEISLVRMAVGTLPWFVTLSLGISQFAHG